MGVCVNNSDAASVLHVLRSVSFRYLHTDILSGTIHNIPSLALNSWE
jgi:hypothetical protein